MKHKLKEPHPKGLVYLALSLALGLGFIIIPLFFKPLENYELVVSITRWVLIIIPFLGLGLGITSVFIDSRYLKFAIFPILLNALFVLTILFTVFVTKGFVWG